MDPTDTQQLQNQINQLKKDNEKLQKELDTEKFVVEKIKTSLIETLSQREELIADNRSLKHILKVISDLCRDDSNSLWKYQSIEKTIENFKHYSCQSIYIKRDFDLKISAIRDFQEELFTYLEPSRKDYSDLSFNTIVERYKDEIYSVNKQNLK